MQVLTILGISVLCALLGLVLTLGIASAYADWYRVPTREGAAGYFVAFWALGGGIAAFVLAVVVASAVYGKAGTGWKACGFAAAAVVGVAAVAFAVVWFGADLPPKYRGRRLELDVEIRCPPGMSDLAHVDPDFAYARVRVPGRGYQMGGRLEVAAAVRVDGRLVVPVRVPLLTSRPDKALVAQLDGQHEVVVPLPLPANPGQSGREWSQWCDGIQDSDRAVTGYQVRYRIVVEEPPPPPPTEEEARTIARTEALARLAAVADDAPIAALFGFVEYGTDEAVSRAAIARLTARPACVRELGEVMVGDEAPKAAAALSVVRLLPAPDAALNPLVVEAGRRIARDLRAFNDTPVEDDPSYEGAAEVSIRFSAWIDAARTLRERCGGDFIPELCAILELSRVRTDSHVVQADVRRVASFYAEKWAGIAPLPGDPKPRRAASA